MNATSIEFEPNPCRRLELEDAVQHPCLLGRGTRAWLFLFALSLAPLAAIDSGLAGLGSSGRNVEQLDETVLQVAIPPSQEVKYVSLAKLSILPGLQGVDVRVSNGHVTVSTRDGSGSALIDIKGPKVLLAKGSLSPLAKTKLKLSAVLPGQGFFLTTAREDILIPKGSLPVAITADGGHSEIDGDTEAAFDTFDTFVYSAVAAETGGLRVEVIPLRATRAVARGKQDRFYLRFQARFTNLLDVPIVVQPGSLRPTESRILYGAPVQPSPFISNSMISYGGDFQRSPREGHGVTQLLSARATGTMSANVIVARIPQAASTSDWLMFSYADAFRNVKLGSVLISSKTGQRLEGKENGNGR